MKNKEIFRTVKEKMNSVQLNAEMLRQIRGGHETAKDVIQK